MRLRRSTVTRLRATPGPPDQYGESVPGPVEELELPAAAVAPGESTERTGPGEISTVMAATAYWRGKWPDVVAGDRLRIDGHVWDVQGDPACWPLGTVATLRRVERGDR